MVVPLQVNGGVRLRSHLMEQTKFRLLTVEHAFFSAGRGVNVLPNIPYASYSGPRERLVTLRTLSGRETTEFLRLIGPFVTVPPKELYYQCLLTDVAKDDVPIGTELWLRSRLQEEFCDALYGGDIGHIEALVQAGADVNQYGARGHTPLMFAAEWGRVDIARLLLDSGADVNRSDAIGDTPLQYAVDRSLAEAVPGDEPSELIMLFLERGASVSAVDYLGETALDLAARYGPNKIVDLLRSWQEHPKSKQGAAPSAGSADAPPKSVS